MDRPRHPRNITGAAVLATLAVSISAGQTTTIRVPVDLVPAPTTVVSKDGHLIRDLQKTDFQLYDNGRLQRIELDDSSQPISIVLAIQANQDTREYLPFIAKAGSLIENSLLGETGEAAILTYNDGVQLDKPFEAGDIGSTLKKISATGERARMIDAGLQAIELLKERPRARAKILLFVGQPMDSGSVDKLKTLEDRAQQENVSIYAMALPEFGKAFVSDTFYLQGLSSTEYKGGFEAGVELTKLAPALSRSSKAKHGTDPFSMLTKATGGTQLHFRKQTQLEDALTTIGDELRGVYLLSYSPDSTTAGYHEIRIVVDVPGATTASRAGYTRAAK